MTLYILISTLMPGTIRVKGRINGVSLVILLDTGSTHNFIDVAIVSSLNLFVNYS